VTASRSSVSASSVAGTLAFLLALASGAEEARAERRIVVLDFSGPQAARFQRDVERLVRADHELVPARRYRSAARELKATTTTPRNVRRVAARAGVDGVVVGEVARRRGRYELEVRVLSGSDGRPTGGTITATTRAPGLSGAARRQVIRGLRQSLRDLPEVRPDRGRDDRRAADGQRPRRGAAADDDGERRKRRAAAEDDDRQRERSRARRRAAARDDGRSEDRERDRARSVRDREREKNAEKDPPPPITDERTLDLLARSRAVDVQGGLSTVGRKLSFNFAPDLGMDAPQEYAGGMVPAAFIAGELYPLAFDLEADSPKRDIGVTGVFERVLQIRSTVPGRSDIILPTEQQRYAVGLVFRKNLGSSPASPTVKASVRYNRAHFQIDRSPAEAAGINIDVPNVDYTYFDPGAAIRYPLSPKLAVNAEARFLLPTSTGEIQQAEQYGPATVTGVDVDLGVEYRYTPQILIRAGVRGMGFAFDFDGQGDLIDRNGDGSADVGGALDRYLGAYLTAGYLY
jgi:hypothetical protein